MNPHRDATRPENMRRRGVTIKTLKPSEKGELRINGKHAGTFSILPSHYFNQLET